MARRAGDTTRRGQSNGQPSGPPPALDTVPPPSTIAAQIVNNHSKTNEQREPENKNIFGDLLQEFLKDPSAEEQDVKLNLQLISIIVEAGFNSLLTENPFAPDAARNLLPQAIDSIAVIRVTIERNPDLLFYQDPEVGEAERKPPLAAWLFPRLLLLVGRANLGAIQAQVEELISVLVEVLSNSRRAWGDGILLFNVYRACVDAIIAVLDSKESHPFFSHSPFKIALPPASAIRNFLPGGGQLIALPQGCQAEFNNLSQAVAAALTLLSAVSKHLLSNQHASPATAARKFAPDWVADCCNRLWHHVANLKVLERESTNCERILLLFLSISQAVGPTASRTENSVSSSIRTTVLYLDSMSRTLHANDYLIKFPEVQIELAKMISRSCIFLREAEISTSIDRRSSDTFKFLFQERLVPVLQALNADAQFLSGLSTDLQLPLLFCFATHVTSDGPSGNEQIVNNLKSLRESHASTDMVLARLFDDLFGEELQDDFPDNERPKKRRRLNANSSAGSNSQFASLLNKVGDHLGTDVDDSAMLRDVGETFAQREDDDKCKVLESLMRLPCAAVGSLKMSMNVSDEKHSTAFCAVCDATIRSQDTEYPYWDEPPAESAWKESFSALTQISQMPELQQSTRSRVLLAVATRILFSHLSPTNGSSLAGSPLGDWNLRALHSSLRELRIAAAQVLPVFLREDLPENIRKSNRLRVLGFMKSLAQRNNVGEQEAIILGWGNVARTCGEMELNIAILELVTYLGNTHPLLCGIAYAELSSLAEGFRCSPAELLKPYWGSIAFDVVKDLFARPQKAQQLSDLLEISVNQLLLMTQAETLPYLVLTKRKDVLQRMASARGPNATIQDVCMQPRRNLAGILTKLLLHSSTNIEKTAMEVLCEVVPAFKDFDLSSLIQTEPILIACEMLKAAVGKEESEKKEIHQSILTFAVLAERKPGQSKSSVKPTRMLASFLDTHILGIMTFFSDIIDSPKEPHPMSERNRCLGAIEEMIRLAGKQVNIALPQIRACLQSAFDVPQLLKQAFSVWDCLLKTIDEDDLEPLVDQTFAIVAQHCRSFDEELQVKAHEMISTLIRNFNELLKSRIDMLPSLAGVPSMSKIEAEIDRLRPKTPVENFKAFTQRCQDENATVVIQALKELIPFLEENQRFIHDSAVSQQPGPVVSDLCRSVLDACVRFAESNAEIPILSAQCLGLIGCLDPSRTETVRPRKDILVLSNFERANETIDFVAFFLETVLVKAFHSATNAKAQGFLAHAMQELLKFCGFNQVANYRPRSSQSSPVHQQWMEISESVRNTLTPFLSSKYEIRTNKTVAPDLETYPIFHPGITHGTWLRSFVYDLLRRGKGDNAGMVFPVFARVIRGHDLSISTFMLPFAAVNIILGGTDQEVSDVAKELLTVLEHEIHGSGPEVDNIKQCSENVFQVLDYMSKWLQDKRKSLAEARILAARSGREYPELEEQNAVAQISAIERILHSIPAEVISRRAVECGSYARALFHWEQYMRKLKDGHAAISADDPDREMHYQHLQNIYTQIDEPDSIDGISAHLQILDPNQQVLEHRKAGRWNNAQNWYEMLLAEKPNDVDYQYELLHCLRESGQYDSLLAHFDNFGDTAAIHVPRILSFAAEATWVTGKWQVLELTLERSSQQLETQDFNVGVGKALLALRNKDVEGFSTSISALRESIARGLSPSTTASLQACHDHMLKLHILYEIEAISGTNHGLTMSREDLLGTLDRRVDILGAYTADKQFILGIRRAVMELSNRDFSKLDLASVWLKSARLARKANLTSIAFDAVIRAQRLGEDEAKIEHSRLLWKDGHHRKAIQNLEGAIKANAFRSHDMRSINGTDSMAEDPDQLRNKLAARAYLLWAKWLDQAGQTGSDTIIGNYNTAVRHFPRWEKGHYYLGKHYNKQLEGEKTLPRSKRSLAANCGETANLVVSSYLRSLGYGSKYLYQTVPKLLTLWLDLGMDVQKDLPPRVSEREQERLEKEGNLTFLRASKLEQMNKQIKKYAIERLPPYVFYTALPQMITRISHPHTHVYDLLSRVIVRVASVFAQQSLWSLLAVVKSTSADRSTRGSALLAKMRESGRRNKSETSGPDLKSLIVQGQKLSDSLLHACDATVDSRTPRVSLSKDLGFSHKLAPCHLVVPVEKTLTASLPTTQEVSVRSHKPFNGNIITISGFLDEVLVLSSLQRPRKLTVRGSDGRYYGLLCKPKDDLRKDQRLMEFNAMINRALLRDIESSKRRLDIKTYAVTPLNEECGAIEWVEGLKPMRDIIIKLLRHKGVHIDYNEVKILLAEACLSTKNLPIFTDRILKMFKPVLYEWFIESFPEPEAWFNARLKYTRTCAVMSIVGHVLGLGDRHGENVLLREENGGVFHVDFNCLFDKGLTFEKPELVPFRLTHNMVDAMGACGVEGPFRLAAELTLSQLRQNSDTLMTILETFLYDPTADFIGKKKRLVPGVPTTPEEVLESVSGKVKGLLKGESVPLSVEGYVDALISQARDPKNLAAMYIGWCAFF